MSDFVIKRRRSRYTAPVDLCLGYYAGDHDKLASVRPTDKSERGNVKQERVQREEEERFVPSSVPAEIDLEFEQDSSQCHDVYMDVEEEHSEQEGDEWSVLASSKPIQRNESAANHGPDAVDSEYLTVDKFLKQATKINRKSTKKFGKPGKRVSERIKGPKRRYCTLRQLPNSDSPSKDKISQPSSDFVPDSPTSKFASSPAPLYNHGPRKRKKLWKKRKSLRTRLYEAAISTHVEPEAVFAQAPDDLNADRPPLRFLPADIIGDAVPKKASSWSLVDPRKSRAMENARFPAVPRPRVETGLASTGLSNMLDRFPIASWQWGSKPEVVPAGIVDSKNNGGAHDADTERQISVIYPPLMFVPLDQAEHMYHENAQYRRHRLSERKENKKRSASPNHLNLQPIKASTSRKKPRNENQALNLQPALQLSLAPYRAQASQPTRPEILQLDVQQNISSPSLVNDISSSQPVVITGVGMSQLAAPAPELQSPADTKSTQKSPPGSIQVRKRTVSPGPLSRPSTSKPLKPLVSFMDEFMENLRSVNMAAMSQNQELKKARPSSRPKSSSSRLVSAAHYDNSDEQIFPMRDNAPATSNELLELGEANESFDGPDLSTLFQPQDYRVVLS